MSASPSYKKIVANSVISPFAIRSTSMGRQNEEFAHKKSPAAKMQAGQKSRLAERGPGCEGGACQMVRA
jgi:hypothetical protein